MKVTSRTAEQESCLPSLVSYFSVLIRMSDICAIPTSFTLSHLPAARDHLEDATVVPIRLSYAIVPDNSYCMKSVQNALSVNRKCFICQSC